MSITAADRISTNSTLLDIEDIELQHLLGGRTANHNLKVGHPKIGLLSCALSRFWSGLASCLRGFNNFEGPVPPFGAWPEAGVMTGKCCRWVTHNMTVLPFCPGPPPKSNGQSLAETGRQNGAMLTLPTLQRCFT